MAGDWRRPARACLRPRGRIVDRRVVRELGLQDVPAQRREAARGLDDAPPARFAGQLVAGHRIEPQGLDEQRRSAVRQAAATSATNRSWAAAFAASWW
jgi:hypothetical protein